MATSSVSVSALQKASNVDFGIDDIIYGFNNGVGFLDHKDPGYDVILRFLKNCWVSTALTKVPSKFFIEYLAEFWYTAEPCFDTNSITFSLSSSQNRLTINLDEFRNLLGLNFSETFEKEPHIQLVKSFIQTLGLKDDKTPVLTSAQLVASSPLKIRYFSPRWRVFMLHIVKCLGGMQGSHDQLNTKQQMIAFGLIWGHKLDFGKMIFTDLMDKLANKGKRARGKNVCYQRFLMLIFEYVLGDKFQSAGLTEYKPYALTASSFPKTLPDEAEPSLFMKNVAEVFSAATRGEDKPDDEKNKSLSRTAVSKSSQPPPKEKSKRKKKAPSSQPILTPESPPPQVAEQHPAVVSVATAEVPICPDAAGSAQMIVSQPETAAIAQVPVCHI